LYNRFAAKGQPKKGKKKACKKNKCQGCEMCASLLQADAVAIDALDYDYDVGASSDAPICDESDVREALNHMHGGCYNKVTTAITNNTPLGDTERCFCYLQVDSSIAMALQCRSMAAKTHTIAQDYRACETGSHQYGNEHGTCHAPRMTGLINAMSSGCQDDLYIALETGQPLDFERRCECYLEIEQQTALKVSCRSMQGKEHTVAEEYQQCLDARAKNTAA
jgi:hypothetical protein